MNRLLMWLGSAYSPSERVDMLTGWTLAMPVFKNRQVELRLITEKKMMMMAYNKCAPGGSTPGEDHRSYN